MSGDFWIGFYFGAITVGAVAGFIALAYLERRIDDALVEARAALDALAATERK